MMKKVLVTFPFKPLGEDGKPADEFVTPGDVVELDERYAQTKVNDGHASWRLPEGETQNVEPTEI